MTGTPPSDLRGARESRRRIHRAVQTARECATADPGLAEIKLKRFHRAMDVLEPGEGEQVYDVLRHEGWYQVAAQALARSTGIVRLHAEEHAK